MGQKRSPGPLQPRFQAATSGDGAIAASRHEVFNQSLSILQRPHDTAQPDLRRRSRQHCRAARAASGGHDPGLPQRGHYLDRMMPRQGEFIRQFHCGKRAVRQAGNPHQRPQAKIGERGQAHINPLLIGICNTYYQGLCLMQVSIQGPLAMTVVNNPHAHEAGATLAISPPAISARPQMTADLMVRTGLDDAMLARLVHAFYDRIRSDPQRSAAGADLCRSRH